MSDPHGKFVWYELMTTDTAAAETFYKSAVGWTSRDSGHPDMAYTLFSAGENGVGGMMALPEAACKAGARPGWLGYIWVRDLDAAVDQLKAAGGSVHKSAEDIPGVGRFAVVADPQGASFVLFKHAGDETGPDIAPETPGHVGWHELHAVNGVSAFGFYEGMFGWEKSGSFDMGPPVGVYQTFNTAEKQGGGMMTKMPNMPVPVWNYYFNVSDINAAAERLTAAGGQVVMAPHQVPGGSWIVQCLDPQGGAFALLAPATK